MQINPDDKLTVNLNYNYIYIYIYIYIYKTKYWTVVFLSEYSQHSGLYDHLKSSISN